MNKILGVDIGGVLIDRQHDRSDTSFFGAHFLDTPAVAGAFSALADLNRSGWRIHLVSKCGAEVQRRTRLWLQASKFFQTTGMRPENLHFCLERRQKAPLCERLGVTHFVDDRLDVLDYLTGVAHRYLFQPNDKDARRHRRCPESALRIDDWRELAELLHMS